MTAIPYLANTSEFQLPKEVPRDIILWTNKRAPKSCYIIGAASVPSARWSLSKSSSRYTKYMYLLEEFDELLRRVPGTFSFPVIVFIHLHDVGSSSQ
jgi:hypothetical protein